VVAQPKASFHIPRKTWPSMVDPRCKLGISFLRSLLSDFSSIRMTCVSCCYSTFSTPDVVAGARLHLTQRCEGCGRVTRYSYLDTKSNWSLAVSLRLTIPVPIRMMFRAFHTYRHGVNRGNN
jgi:hypothetical protein